MTKSSPNSISSKKSLRVNELVPQAQELFKDCGFLYFICGGFALDMFAGKELRPHGDFDISVFMENKREVVDFLHSNGWPVYARFASVDNPDSFKEFYLLADLPSGKLDECENMWAVKPGSFAEMYLKDDNKGIYSYRIHEPRLQGFDFIELAFNMQKDGKFVCEGEQCVELELDKAILYKDGVPYMAPELVLFLKSHPFYSQNDYQKPKTEFDFKAVMPFLPDESRQWLINELDRAYPDGYEWLGGLLAGANS